MGLQLGGRPGDCPVTEDISDRLVRLPLFYDITDDEVAQVLNSVKSFEF
jgi:dTDP-4-amino-4,6-dideoxygalactose transaminase